MKLRTRMDRLEDAHHGDCMAVVSLDQDTAGVRARITAEMAAQGIGCVVFGNANDAAL